MGLIGVGDLLAQYIEIKLTVKKAREKDVDINMDKNRHEEDEHSLFKRYDAARTGKNIIDLVKIRIQVEIIEHIG